LPALASTVSMYLSSLIQTSVSVAVLNSIFYAVKWLSELNLFLFILKVANIRCFIQIKCSKQEAWFKKYLTPKVQSKMDIPEKLATLGTQDLKNAIHLIYQGKILI
jgi:hypothetical protein